MEEFTILSDGQSGKCDEIIGSDKTNWVVISGAKFVVAFPADMIKSGIGWISLIQVCCPKNVPISDSIGLDSIELDIFKTAAKLDEIAKKEVTKFSQSTQVNACIKHDKQISYDLKNYRKIRRLPKTVETEK